MTIDYRDLLKKYIDHVATQAGVDFLSPRYNDSGIFTRDEWEELLKVSEELREDFYGEKCL